MSVLTQIVGVFPGQEATIQAHLSRFDIVKPTPGGSQIQPRNFNVSAKGKAVPGPDVLAVTVPLTSASTTC